ncbi:MAG: ATP-binding cassette domain-containing protein [Gammaproteobacteria bacterium]
MQANKTPLDSVKASITLSTNALSKIYQTGDVKVHALRDVDLSLYESELIVLLGASGSGKSTLVNIIGGLDTPTSGQAIERVNQELGTTTVLITHNAVISDMADRVITLADGQVKSISDNSQRSKPKDLSW